MSLNLAIVQSPYIVGNPVPPERLFGRDDVLRYLGQQLGAPANQIVILFGQRRVGKSSILRALPQCVPALVTAFLDLQALKTETTVKELIRATGRIVAQAVGLPAPGSTEQVTDAFWDKTTQAAMDQGRRLTLAIDETDELEVERGPFSEYRHWLLSLQRSQSKLAFILAVGHPPSRLLHLQPFIKSGPNLVLNVLDESNARKVLLTPDGETMSLNFEESAIKAALNLTGRHPFYLQALGDTLFTLMGEAAVVSRDQVEQAMDTVIERTQPQLAWYWQEFGSAERTVLAALALILEENPQARLGDDQQAIRQIADVLTRYETHLDSLDVLSALKVLRDFRILDADNHIQVELVRRWLLREHSLARLRLTAQERVERLYQQGRQAQAKGRLRDALKLYREAVQEKPDYAPARLALADVQAILRYYPEALQSYRAAFNLSPDLAREKFESFLITQAQDALDERQLARAVDLYQQALQLRGPRQAEIERALRQIAPQQARISVDLVPEMILIPAGEFVHGLDWLDARQRLERAGVATEGIERLPPRRVCTLPAYRIALTQVTNMQYQQFVRDTGYRPPRDWTAAGDFPPGRDDYPVVYVSWQDTQAFCKWLSERTGRRFRLPTEWEWEKAARGGLYLDGDRSRAHRNPNPDRLWPWGDDWQSPVDLSQLLVDNTDVEQLRERLLRRLTGQLGDESPTSPVIKIRGLDYFLPSVTLPREGERTEPPRFLQPVQGRRGTLKQGPYGLFGLVGNVREWCEAVNEETGRPGDRLGRRAYKGAPAQLSPVMALCSTSQPAYSVESRPDVSFRLVEETKE